MTLRVTASLATFAASQSGAEAISPVLNITNYVSSNVSLNPSAVQFADPSGFPPDLLVTQIVLRSTLNPTEVAQRLYMGPGVPIQAAMGAFGRLVTKNIPLTHLHFTADHGLELVFTYDNGTTAVTSTIILWDIQNQVGPGDLNNPLPAEDVVVKMAGNPGLPGGLQSATQARTDAFFKFNHMPGGSNVFGFGRDMILK